MIFEPVSFIEPRRLYVGFSREGGSWDEMGLCCDNVKPLN